MITHEKIIEAQILEEFDTTQRALLLRIADAELIRRVDGLAWANGSTVTAEENESLRVLWRDGNVFNLPENTNGGTVTLTGTGQRAANVIRCVDQRAAQELEVFGAPPSELSEDDESC